MIDGPFRAYLETHVTALIALYQRLGVTPNQITLAGLLIAMLAAAVTTTGAGVIAALIWWAGRLLDGTDGIYARATNQASSFGAYLDIVCDMAAYSAMLVGFYFLHPDLGAWWLVMSILYTLCITSALAMGDVERNLQVEQTDRRGLRLGAGLAEAGETGIAYTLFLLFPSWIEVLVGIWICVLVTTVVARTILVRGLTTSPK